MIVGLGHVARTGKDSFASILVERHGFTRLAFADALREFVYRTSPTIREQVDGWGWEQAKLGFPGVRQALVDVGNAARQIMGEDVWIRAVARQIKPGRDYVITDVRYPNEVEFVQSLPGLNGVAVRIDRPGVEPLPNVADQALAGWDGWDVVIPNDGTVAELAEKADRFLRYWRREDRP